MKFRRSALPYLYAVRWVANNDDTEFLNDEDPVPSVTVCFLADIYQRTVDDVMVDLRKELAKIENTLHVDIESSDGEIKVWKGGVLR